MYSVLGLRAHSSSVMYRLRYSVQRMVISRLARPSASLLQSRQSSSSLNVDLLSQVHPYSAGAKFRGNGRPAVPEPGTNIPRAVSFFFFPFLFFFHDSHPFGDSDGFLFPLTAIARSGGTVGPRLELGLGEFQWPWYGRLEFK